ncbi:MAG TPA: YkgJ family cysteine cluster protein, partial [Burkholderiaceae bacterium]|nr:YkgJ family cysteine cluster protein [Burkholderiaceae bacterium]
LLPHPGDNSSIEADLIGRDAGVAPATPVQAVQAVRLQEFEDMEEATAALAAISSQVEPSPCPFLRDGACSVYDVRPMACRLLLNLDDDDLLCQLVPYANGQQLKAFFLLAQPAAAWADIRDFFPALPPVVQPLNNQPG